MPHESTNRPPSQEPVARMTPLLRKSRPSRQPEMSSRTCGTADEIGDRIDDAHVDPRLRIGANTGAHRVAIAHDRHRVAEPIGNARGDAPSIALGEGLADLPRLICEADPLEALVVTRRRGVGAEDRADQVPSHGRVIDHHHVQPGDDFDGVGVTPRLFVPRHEPHQGPEVSADSGTMLRQIPSASAPANRNMCLLSAPR